MWSTSLALSVSAITLFHGSVYGQGTTFNWTAVSTGNDFVVYDELRRLLVTVVY